jgi:hypothetical protein
MAIVITDFAGELPKLKASQLGDQQASSATDCDFSTTAVQGLLADGATTYPAQTSVALPFEAFVYSDADTGPRLFHWDGLTEFSAARGPVQRDSFKRFYWTEAVAAGIVGAEILAAGIDVPENSFTLTNHGLANNDRVQFDITVAGITGVVEGAVYYVVGAVANVSFQVSATRGGSPIAITKTGSPKVEVTKVTRGFYFTSVDDDANDPVGGGLFSQAVAPTTKFKVGVSDTDAWNASANPATSLGLTIGESATVPAGALMPTVTGLTVRSYIVDTSLKPVVEIGSLVLETANGVAANGWPISYTLDLDSILVGGTVETQFENGNVVGNPATVAVERREGELHFFDPAENDFRTESGVVILESGIRKYVILYPSARAPTDVVTFRLGPDIDNPEFVLTVTDVASHPGRVFYVGAAGASVPTSYVDAAVPFDSGFKVAVDVSGTAAGAPFVARVVDAGVPADVALGAGVRLTLTTTTPDTELELTFSYSTESSSEDRAYIFTLVNKYGEESAPSVPVDFTHTGDGVSPVLTLTNATLAAVETAVIANGYAPLNGVRIYRSVVGNSSGAFFYVATVKTPSTAGGDLPGEYYPADEDAASETFTWTDVIPASRLTDSITTIDHIDDAAELQDLRGTISISNGMLASFRDNEVWLCEPYKPWAYKRANVVTLPHKVVALLHVEQGFLALTDAVPYQVSGAAPGDMQHFAIGGTLPCIGLNAVASVAGLPAYLSPDGPVFVTGGQAQLDQAAWDRAAFQTKLASIGVTSTNPVRLTPIGNKLIMWARQATAGVPPFGGYVLDFVTRSWAKVSQDFTQLLRLPPGTFGATGPATDALGYTSTGGTVGWKLYAHDAGNRRKWKWDSKDYSFARPMNFQMAQLFGTGTVRLSVWTDGVRRNFKTANYVDIVLSDNGVTQFLPSGFLSSRWKLEFEDVSPTGSAVLNRLAVVESVKELSGGA